MTNAATAALTQVEMLAPPVAVNRTLAIERLDYNTPDGKERLMGRVVINRLAEPDFIWSPTKTSPRRSTKTPSRPVAATSTRSRRI